MNASKEFFIKFPTLSQAEKEQVHMGYHPQSRATQRIVIAYVEFDTDTRLLRLGHGLLAQIATMVKVCLCILRAPPDLIVTFRTMTDERSSF